MFYQNDLAMRKTANVIGGEPIVVCSQSISGVFAVGLLIVVQSTAHQTINFGLLMALIPRTLALIINSLLMSPLLGHRPSLWITHKENKP
jgi:hypothetical protein